MRVGRELQQMTVKPNPPLDTILSKFDAVHITVIHFQMALRCPCVEGIDRRPPANVAQQYLLLLKLHATGNNYLSSAYEMPFHT